MVRRKVRKALPEGRYGELSEQGGMESLVRREGRPLLLHSHWLAKQGG